MLNWQPATPVESGIARIDGNECKFVSPNQL
jgi:hypothetical protein